MIPAAKPAPKFLHDDKWMIDYLVGKLAPKLGIAPFFEEVEPAAGSGGASALIVRPRSGKPFFMQCFRRRSEGEALAEKFKFVASLDLPVPEMLFSDVSWRHHRAHGFGVVVEEYIAGRRIEEGSADGEQLAGLARALGRMHAEENQRWGEIGHLHRGSYFEGSMVKKIEHRLAGIAKHDKSFKDSERREILAFVKSCKKDWNGGPPYSLTHDHVSVATMLFGAGGRAAFTDLSSLRFATPGRDLVCAMHHFCRDAKDRQSFKRLYFAAAGGARRDHFERFEPLYWIGYHLRRWESRAKTPRDGGGAGREREAVFVWIERG